MSSLTGLRVLATGSFIPNNSVSNEMLETLTDTSNEWIVSRTGIKSRCFADGDTNLSMTTAACSAALSDAHIDYGDIALIICATITNDFMTPSLACLLQRELNLPESILAFDINAACSGFVYALSIAQRLLPPGKFALITGSEVLSRIVDFSDRATCVLFGDGSAAVVAELADSPFVFASGAKGDSHLLSCPAPSGLKPPFSLNTPACRTPFIRMDGAEVFRFAIDSIKKSVSDVLFRAKVAVSEIDHFIFHQANARIIAAAAKKLGAPIERFFLNIDRRGNTSAASIPIALDELNKSGKLKRGEKILLSGFGGGLTYGSLYFTW